MQPPKYPFKVLDVTGKHPFVADVTKKKDFSVIEKSSLTSAESTRQKQGCAGMEVDNFALPTLCKAIDEIARTAAAPVVEAILSSCDSGKRVVLIASGSRQSGRTTTAIWIAAACARTDMRVALIDADVKNPSISSELSILPTAGWERFSKDNTPISDYLIDSIADRFAVLPCIGEQSLTQWPYSWNLASILESLRDHYDAVLIDAPPLERLGLGSQMLADCGPFIDAALWLDSSPMNTKWALEQFQAAGIQLLGLIQRAQLAARAA